MTGKILIIDDEDELLAGLAEMFGSEFPEIEVITTTDPAEVLEIVKLQDINLVLTDIRMPEIDGLQLLYKIKNIAPVTTVIVMTAFGSIDMAVEAVKIGAYDFITKPFDYKNLFRSIKKGLEHNQLVKENITLKRRIADRVSFEGFVGQSAPMLRFYENIRAVAHTNYNILIRGASGTGKELAAKAIFNQSDRRDANLVMVNCPAIPEHLLESELFGHKKGAFTGADRDHKGLFIEAHGGTICLDEIGDIALAVQVKLLRVLQEGEVRPLGSSVTQKVDVRVVAMTNQDIEEKIKQGLFREDLFYRLNVVTIRTPELDEIREDIPLLINYFGKLACMEQGTELKKFSAEFIKAMTSRPWPGNVRQLQNIVRRAVVFCTGDKVCLENMEPVEQNHANVPFLDGITADLKKMSYKAGKERLLREFSQYYIGHLLRQTHGNVTKAAILSGLSRAALQKIMNRFEIDSGEFRNSLTGSNFV